MTGKHNGKAIDIVIAGAGPAGMAAAVTAASHGAQVHIIDEQPGPGGQIYRATETTPLGPGGILGKDYGRGALLAAALRSCGAEVSFGATIWALTEQNEIAFSIGGEPRIVRAHQIILATGAIERPMPIPGWTLPGVMTAGAGQILLKSSGLVPEGPFVLAGTGPLLWLLAAQYLRAGARPLAMLDTTPAANAEVGGRHAAEFLVGPYGAKGIALMIEVKRRVPVIRGVRGLEVEESAGRISGVRYTDRHGRQVSLGASALFLHQGVIPNLSLIGAAECMLAWDETSACFRPTVDDWGQTSRLGVRVAGDGAAISGALAAEAQGRIAGLGALRDLGLLSHSQALCLARPLRRVLRHALRGRRFLDRWFLPDATQRGAQGETTVCRCEEVTASSVIGAAGLGFDGPNRVKALLRCGMGPCQGRLCGPIVNETLSAAQSRRQEDIGIFRLRLPIKPVSLGELAALPSGPTDRFAVNGLDETENQGASG